MTHQTTELFASSLQIQVLVFQKSIKNISMTASLRPTILNLDSDWA